MFDSFRKSMTWVHTWFGLVLGFVLMVVFFFGSMSVFDREIDRWALPETRFEPQSMPSFDRMLVPIFKQMTPEPDELRAASERVTVPLPDTLSPIGWGAYTTHRDPVLNLYSEFAVPNNPDDPDDHVHGHITIDPRSGSSVPQDQLKLGSDFFYPMHFSLHLRWLNMGYWLVGLAALIMLGALVSGVVVHRKLFAELFTFRSKKEGQRSLLDLHNLTGVLALPFHFVFALSGLIIFAGIYLPVSNELVTPLHELHEQYHDAESEGKGLPVKAAGVPASLASVDTMVEEAKRHWAAQGSPGDVGFLWVSHLGDANSYVSIFRAGNDRVSLVGQGIHFAGPSGRVLYKEPEPGVIESINEFLTGLHLQHFEHWLLRWLYVLGGLSGCVCIATGLIFFVAKRRVRHASQSLSGARWVDALAASSITGMLVATASMLVGNRLLAPDLAGRGEWEQRIFWGAWLLAVIHAAWRSAPVQHARLAPAWREQTWAIAALTTAAVLLNWITTGDHLLKTMRAGYWPVAGFDLTLLAVATLAVVAALQLAQRERRLGVSATGNPATEEMPSQVGAREAAHG